MNTKLEISRLIVKPIQNGKQLFSPKRHWDFENGYRR